MTDYIFNLLIKCSNYSDIVSIWNEKMGQKTFKCLWFLYILRKKNNVSVSHPIIIFRNVSYGLLCIISIMSYFYFFSITLCAVLLWINTSTSHETSILRGRQRKHGRISSCCGKYITAALNNRVFNSLYCEFAAVRLLTLAMLFIQGYKTLLDLNNSV